MSVIFKVMQYSSTAVDKVSVTVGSIEECSKEFFCSFRNEVMYFLVFFMALYQLFGLCNVMWQTNYTSQQDFGTRKVYCVSNVTLHAESKYAIKIFPSPTVFVQWPF